MTPVLPGRRWLLPSAVVAELDPERTGRGGRPRRTARDWAVDFGCFLLAVVIGAMAAHTLTRDPNTPHALAVVDQWLGGLACLAVWSRRRRPLGLAVAMIPVGVLSNTAGGAGLVALFTLAVHRPLKYVGWVGGLQLALLPVYFWLRPDPELPYAAAIAVSALLTVAVVGWGMFVRSKRQLMLSLRDRARRAETEAELRAEQAQRLAREAIAREMHDALAHRLTLLSVHAGALEFRPDAPHEEVARAAGVIRESAHEALQDLREIIGVLRAGDSDDAGRPQPTLGALDALVSESREAGMKVVLDLRVADAAAVPASVGRTVYRIAQEGLTNARKHAPGAEVTVGVSGAPGDGLSVSVTNPAPPGEVPHVPGSGQGLIGLTERSTLAGGRLEHGSDGGGGFTVRAWLPWGG
ncbi:histidine kinase [Streptomyces sp. NBC_01728]|uniref:sensor histidine kinase n=1 Tax=unclassified Streptomyces TaxID=2593676 RepID=UPI00225AB22A|nr:MULTISPECIES: histidine kinase [unclassified Streptomyces]MCX4457930.1 histidine kinase [Streptomyces sp. NBC_01719]MCX4497287.1 histidine kinase [Streptomyces sp. NBC_01728]